MIGKLVILGLAGDLFTTLSAVNDLIIGARYLTGRGSVVLDLDFAGSMYMGSLGNRRLGGAYRIGDGGVIIAPNGRSAGRSERVANRFLAQAELGADVVDHFLFGFGLRLLYGVVTGVLQTGLAVEVILRLRDKVYKDALFGLALLNTGADNVADRGDAQRRAVHFGIDASPVNSLGLLGRVNVVLHLGTVGISHMA